MKLSSRSSYFKYAHTHGHTSTPQTDNPMLKHKGDAFMSLKYFRHFRSFLFVVPFLYVLVHVQCGIANIIFCHLCEPLLHDQKKNALRDRTAVDGVDKKKLNCMYDRVECVWVSSCMFVVLIFFQNKIRTE